MSVFSRTHYCTLFLAKRTFSLLPYSFSGISRNKSCEETLAPQEEAPGEPRCTPPALLVTGTAPVRKAITSPFEDAATTNCRIKTGLGCCSTIEQVWLTRRRQAHGDHRTTWLENRRGRAPGESFSPRHPARLLQRSSFSPKTPRRPHTLAGIRASSRHKSWAARRAT